MQATLTYADKLAKGAAAGNATDPAQLAEAVSFFRVIEPLVAEADGAGAEAVAAALAAPPAADTADKVTAAMKPALDAYGITPQELGSLGATSPCQLPQ